MKKFLASAVALVLFTTLAPLSSSAQTGQELQSIINQLLQQITSLQTQIQSLQGGSQTSGGNSVGQTGPVFFIKDLQVGSTGQDVMALQEFLKSQGHFSIDTTTYFGPVTRQALQSFQAANGISPTGYFGPQTRSATERVRQTQTNTQDTNPTPSETPPTNTPPTTTTTSSNNPSSLLEFAINGTSVIADDLVMSNYWNNSGIPTVSVTAQDSLNYSWKFGNTGMYEAHCEFLYPFTSGVYTKGNATVEIGHRFFPDAGERDLWALQCKEYADSTVLYPTTATTYIYVSRAADDPVDPPTDDAELPTVSISASPVTIQEDESSTITLSSSNSTSCFSNLPGYNGKLSGTAVVTPTQTTTYTFSCQNSQGQSASSNTTVTVSSKPLPTLPPYVTLEASPENISEGGSSTIYASATNTSYCTTVSSALNTLAASGANGQQTVTPTETTTYSVTCYNDSGQASTASATVNVEAAPVSLPTATLTASPSFIKPGESSTIYASVSDADYCTTESSELNFRTLVANGANGQASVSPTQNTTYSMTCHNSAGQVEVSTTVYVNSLVNPRTQSNAYSAIQNLLLQIQTQLNSF